jgi:acetylornithine deacetylase/succinyl-diaminopimelate desuccinylase-like protein
VTYDRRLLPGDTPETVLAAASNLPGCADIDLRVQIGQGEYTAYTGAVLRATKFFPAWAFPEEEWFVRQAMQGLHKAGLTPRFNAYRFCTNAAYSAGVAGVPTVGFGPAQEGDAHVINERLRLPDLIAAARGYAGIIAAVLG